MSTAAVFLDTERSCDILRHPGLLFKLSKLEFSTGLIKQRKFGDLIEDEISTPRFRPVPHTIQLAQK
jgi:hypothetical protein